MYGKFTRIDISSNYKTIVIRQTNGFRIDLYLPNSLFEIIIDTNDQLKINCINENSTILIPLSNMIDSPQILINIQQVIRLIKK